MKYLIYMLLPVLVTAQSIEQLYESIQDSDTYKSKTQSAVANAQLKNAALYQDEWSIGGGIGYANVRDGSDKGSEFGLNVAKALNFGGDAVDEIINKNKNYATLSKKTTQNRMRAQLWTTYGNYCITMQALQAKASLSSIYDDIRVHIQKGVAYGEFDASKGIMAELSLNNLNLQISQLENELQSYEAQIKLLVTFDGQFECKKLSPNFSQIFNLKYSALWPMLQENREIQKKSLSYTQQAFNQVNVSLSYNNEIDTDRYMLNLNIPLTYGSSKNEAKKEAALQRLSSVSHELKAFENSYKQETITLKNRIAIYRQYLKNTERSITSSADKLIAQSNMRFLAGEESLISMLKATETKLQMIETILQLKIQRHSAVGKYMYKYAIDPKEIDNVK
ncbi:hypothetical protein [Sulfurimonas sp. CS5]|uniref:hypothetical protein n=1 Tax=Sulfurimonas sp. CS5 TaxID=3391145 RepID=UPI0039EBD317